MYKYCFVPKCKSTTFATPHKIFLCVPKDRNERKKWFNLAKRDDKTPTSYKTQFHCCEDHFEIQEDMENYMRYKLMGGSAILKKGAFPHKFDCQKEKTLVERPGYEKRRRIEYYEKLLSREVHHEDLQLAPTEFMECEAFSEVVDPINLGAQGSETEVEKKTQDKGVQVNQKTHNKETSTNNTRQKHFDKTRQDCTHTSNTTQLDLNESFESTATSDSISTLHQSYQEEDSFSDHEICNIEYKNHLQKGTLMAMERQPKLLIGISKDCYACIQYLCERIRRPRTDVLMTLKKIRWNEPNALLAVSFGISESYIAKKFHNTLSLIAVCMKDLIYNPPDEDVKLNLPIPFRKRYSRVKYIIDCFEVQIEKPSIAVHQALTWSQYKGCNTIKYLLSITPDGLINFVSEGYGGRVTDTVLFEDCGFLTMLSVGTVVLADRGFKNIAHLLENKGCKLLRPPSVSSTSSSTRSEVMETKRIAALRVHVERSIGRLRDFHMISPHATVDIDYVKILDEIVIIACGIVNLQSPLFKS